MAEGILAPPPPTTTTPPAVQENEDDNPMQVFASPTIFSSTSLPQWARWGPITLHPHPFYQFLYGSGIASAPGKQQDTYVQTFAPGMLINLGDHWTLDYTPTLKFYSTSSFQDTLDHSATLSWGTAYGDWFFRASQGYTTSSDPAVETAEQTDQESYTTSANISYQINDRMSTSLGFNQYFNYLDGSSTNLLLQPLSNSRGWSTMDWLNCTFWPRLSAGLGLGFGYNQQDGSPDNINEQYQGQLNWRATDKISFQLSGGLQDQQYLSGGAGDLLTPIFSAGVQYQPFTQTQIGLTASRSISSSYFQNQDTESTTISGQLQQRLLGEFNLSLSGSYGNSRYVASATGLSTSRVDDLYSFNARLSHSFLGQRGTISVLYQYSKDTSSQSGFVAPGSGFGFSSSQVGFEIGYQY